MGFAFTASDLADWLDKFNDSIGDKLDDWVLDVINRGEARPVVAFAYWAETLPFRVANAGLKGLVDVLRFGNDFEADTNGLGVVKGVALNVLRVVTVLIPEGNQAIGAAKTGIRGAGMLAINTIKPLRGAVGPCNPHAINLVASYLKGVPCRFFATLDEFIKVAGGNQGINNLPLVSSKFVIDRMKQLGLSFREIKGLKSVDEVLQKAATSDGPIHFAIMWVDDKGQHAYHALVAARNGAGQVRIIEYVGGKSGSAKGGFTSWTEFLARKKAAGWGDNVLYAKLRRDAENPVLEWSSKHLRVLEMADGALNIGIPLALGIKFGGGSLESKVADIVTSIAAFLKKRIGDEAPPLPDLTTNPPDFTVIVSGKPPYWYTVKQGIPREDWLSVRADKDYGDSLLWPLIFKATQAEERKTGAVKFVNQNKMWIGQRVFVPDISGISAEERAAARTRGRDWKRVDKVD